jgi:hypothetical protein
MGWGIIPSQLDHSTDATKLTAGKLTAAVAHELPWDAIREDGGLQDFHHLEDRLPLRQPTGDNRAGMGVKDGNQIAIKAVVLAGVEITEIDRPHSVRRQRFKGAPMAWRACDRWHWWSMLAPDTLYGIGGDGNALVVEEVGQALLAKAGVLCLGMQHGIYDALRFGGAVDTGRTIT